ncbi:MAG: hypothetical protein AABY95_11720 [Pseudomonadota bacterium]
MSGLLFAAFTFWLNPMAGLGVLMILVSALMILVAPPIHILIVRGEPEAGAEPASLAKVLLISVGAIVLLIVLLGATGLFNFA